MRPTVAVAMSGGVDSSVAAALLKEQGCDVIGITLQLWPKGAADRDRHHGCCSLDAVEDARRVATRLDIPYYVLDVQQEFSRRVVEPFLQDYEQGRTPNPCISCNREDPGDNPWPRWEPCRRRRRLPPWRRENKGGSPEKSIGNGLGAGGSHRLFWFWPS